jgi:hypothetical protein
LEEEGPTMLRMRMWSGGPAAVAFLIVFCVSVIPADAQIGEGITGRIVDRATGEPISSAQVDFLHLDGSRIGPAGLQTLTGPEGGFAFDGVAEGAYLVQVQHPAYGIHLHPLRIEGRGTAAVEIFISQAAIELPALLVVVNAGEARERAERASPSSRNIRTREEIARAAVSGVTLGDYLGRSVAGISMRTPGGGDIGAYICVEFRGARRGDGPCRPPEVRLDGIVVRDPLSFFNQFSLDGLERIQVIPPADAGGRFGANAGWGVILLETRRAGLFTEDGIPVARRSVLSAADRFDWSLEAQPHPWAKVYGAAFLGNAAGLVAAGALLSQCMDLKTRTFFRGDDYCGAGPLLGTTILAAILPPLTASLAARWAGSTDRSIGRFRQSLLYSLPVFVPGFALASVSAGDSGLTGLEMVGLAVVVLGAPLLNTLADRFFRDTR